MDKRRGRMRREEGKKERGGGDGCLDKVCGTTGSTLNRFPPHSLLM